MSSFYDGFDYDSDGSDGYDFYDDAMTQQYPAVDNCPGRVFPAPRGGDDDNDNICVEKCDNGNLPENYRHGGFQCYNGYAFSTLDVMAYEDTIRKLTLALKRAKNKLEATEKIRDSLIPDTGDESIVEFLLRIHNNDFNKVDEIVKSLNKIEDIYQKDINEYEMVKRMLEDQYLRDENGAPFMPSRVLPKPKARSLPQPPEFGLPPPSRPNNMPSSRRRGSRRLPQAPEFGMPSERILPRHQ